MLLSATLMMLDPSVDSSNNEEEEDEEEDEDDPAGEATRGSSLSTAVLDDSTTDVSLRPPQLVESHGRKSFSLTHGINVIFDS